MATCVLDLYSKPFPLITNRLRGSVYLESDPQALVTSIIDSTFGHPTRLWHYPGLPRTNYKWLLEEIDAGNNVVGVLADFDVVPGALTGSLVRDDVQIKVDTTIGFGSGVNNAVFDGTGGKPDFVGWDIVPSELDGRGILKEGLDYSWDMITGTFVLLQSGDLLQTGTYYNIHFNSQTSSVGNSTPTIFDFEILYTTANIALSNTDFGKKLVCEPAGLELIVNLPDITTVPPGRPLRVDVTHGSGVNRSVEIAAFGADLINFRYGKLFMMSHDSLCIYRVKRPDNSNFWQVTELFGNFMSVGTLVGEDSATGNVWNKIFLNGARVPVVQYKRLFYDFIQKLPAGYVVNYDDWFIANNRVHFSYANSANPANAGYFLCADRRYLYELFVDNNLPGTRIDQTVQSHDHEALVDWSGQSGGSPQALNRGGVALTGAARGYGWHLTNQDGNKIIREGGSEFTRPNSYLTFKYVLA